MRKYNVLIVKDIEITYTMLINTKKIECWYMLKEEYLLFK